MSKFNNPARALSPSRAPVAEKPVNSGPPRFGSPTLISPTPVIVETSPPRESVIVGVGFVMLCAFLLSGYLNDWSYRLLGGKAYLSTICLFLVPAIYLFSGRALAGFQDKVGIWLTCFVLVMLLGVPFSFWRGGSLREIITYCLRALTFFFYVIAFTTTVKRCRTLMMVNVFISFIVVISCALFGSSDPIEGRFELKDSFFLANSNELALQLLLGICTLMYVLFVGNRFTKVFAGLGMMASLNFMLKTGSRGCLVSAVVLLITVLIFTKHRVPLAIATVLAIPLVLLFLPSAALHRLTLVFGDDSQTIAMKDLGAIGSATQRRELLKKSIELTFYHPILGVGMGQFPVAYSGEAEKKGQHLPWLGTHNSYTQVSSECGIPGFICYMAVIGITLTRSFRMYRRSRGKPALKDIEAMAFCMFVTSITYSVATFFFHMAYTVLLPMLAGQVAALHYASTSLLRGADAKAA